LDQAAHGGNSRASAAPDLTTISKRAEIAFPADGTDTDVRLNYLDAVRDNWSRAATQFRRTTLLILVAVVAFELVDSGKVTEVTVGPFKTADLSLVHKLLPAIAAFLLFEMFAFSYAGNRYGEVYTAVLRRVNEKLVEQKLSVASAPAVLSLFGGVRLADAFAPAHATKVVRVVEIVGGASVVTFVGGFLAYEVRAYDHLFDRYGCDDVVVWGSVVFAALNVGRGFLLSFVPGHTDDKPSG
jgi:hypothetical protein